MHSPALSHQRAQGAVSAPASKMRRRPHLLLSRLRSVEVVRAIANEAGSGGGRRSGGSQQCETVHNRVCASLAAASARGKRAVCWEVVCGNPSVACVLTAPGARGESRI